MSDDIVTRIKEHLYGEPTRTSEFLLKLSLAEIERLRKLMSDYVSLWLQVESAEWTYENTRAYYAKFHEIKQEVRGE